ncbi:MAG TPA: C45 family autoproteolytic acyltransferase/hydrolase [Thermotogota bacterium]|nr:C45 family autoproteolytic acyltransferase/hydrolase [Thermotogota bacterium]HRW35302.1 C45 family autoproteolytic acyltransferase/hydrolase [Thermotogota bacterium]
MIHKDYLNISFKGSAYEVGRKFGELAVQNKAFKEFILYRPDFAKDIPPQALNHIIKFIDKYCLNINEEIQGMADVLGVKPEEISYYLFSYKFKGACSHFGLSRRCTENNHTLLARSYEFSDEVTDCIFADIEEEGCARTMGFASIVFGRLDGMNEHGLAVTMTAGIPPLEEFGAEGSMFWTVLRRVLDTCKTVHEAWDVINRIPSGFCPTYLVADQQGDIMLVEQTPDKIKRKIITKESPDHLLAATNHFNLEGMIPLRKHVFKQSIHRYEKILKTFEKDKTYTIEEIQSLLSTRYPEGLSAPYFKEYFGSLWSCIYDCESRTIRKRMGNHSTDWQQVSFDEPIQEGVHIQPVELMDEIASETFWEKIS